jgi:predicted ArsR family transcriptional regulator
MGEIAKSRRLDPQTSHAAGASMKRAATYQAAAVLNCLRAIQEAGPEEIGDLIGMEAYAVRKRLPELQDAGLAEPTEERRKTRSGRSERIWRIV